jgi:hypothetical protein
MACSARSRATGSCSNSSDLILARFHATSARVGAGVSNRFAPHIDALKRACRDRRRGTTRCRRSYIIGRPPTHGATAMPAICHPLGEPPRLATFGPDADILGGLGCRRWKLRLSFAPPLPRRKSAVANHSCSRGGVLVAHGTCRSSGGGKLNDLSSLPHLRKGVQRGIVSLD